MAEVNHPEVPSLNTALNSDFITVVMCVDQKILSQVDSLRRQNLSLEYRNSQLQEVCNICVLYIMY